MYPVICRPSPPPLTHHPRQVTPVDEPSKYGVVLSDCNGVIHEFIEKPKVSLLVASQLQIAQARRKSGTCADRHYAHVPEYALQRYHGSLVNAGIYILNPEVLTRILVHSRDAVALPHTNTTCSVLAHSMPHSLGFGSVNAVSSLVPF